MEFSPQKLKSARGEMSLSEAAMRLSNELGQPISRQTIWNWEQGRVRNPNSSYLQTLAKIYRVDAASFFKEVALLHNRQKEALPLLATVRKPARKPSRKANGRKAAAV